MKLLKATFEQIYFTGAQYLNRRLGAEVLLEEGETLEDGWRFMIDRANAMHKKEFPHLYESTVTKEREHPLTINEVQVEKTEEREVGNVIDGINSCTELTVLKTYHRIAAQKEEWQKAYMKKFQELSNE